MDNIKVNLELTVAHINAILKHLAKGAYEEVAELIGMLHSQAKPQVDAATQPPADEPEKAAE